MALSPSLGRCSCKGTVKNLPGALRKGHSRRLHSQLAVRVPRMRWGTEKKVSKAGSGIAGKV